MKTTIVVLALAASMLTAAPVLAQGSSIDDLCGPDGPQAYKRPGGYCETIGRGSISDHSGGAAADPDMPTPKLEGDDLPDGCEFVCVV